MALAKYMATYAGTVEDVNDPERLGRLKVRVPAAYGPLGALSSISTTDLPWALPTGLPAGGSADSGAICWLPVVGDHVYVRFLDGEPEKPIWEWGGQDRKQADSTGFWRRDPGGYEGSKAPKTSLLTRYGQSLQFSPSGLVMTTGRGVALILTDATDSSFGLARLQTTKGYSIRIDDNKDEMRLLAPDIWLMGGATVNQIGNNINVVAASVFQLNASTVKVAMGRMMATASIDVTVTTPIMSVVSQHIALGAVEASDPVVRLSDLQAAVSSIVSQFNAHIHNTRVGPTSTPTSQMSVTPTGSSVTYST